MKHSLSGAELCDIALLLSSEHRDSMHIVVIAWLWVILMMAITERSLAGGVLTFVFYGLAPCGLLLWMIATQRKFNRSKRGGLRQPPAAGETSMREEEVESGDGKHAQRD